MSGFDDAAGYGTITSADGRSLFFQCTAIADGSRTIEVGTPVVYDVRPGHLGRYEAHAIRSVSS